MGKNDKKSGIISMIKGTLYYTARTLYNLIPLSDKKRIEIYTRFAPWFSWILNITKAPDKLDDPDYREFITKLLNNEGQNDVNHYISWQENKPLIHSPVKILAFYLPQFHAIPENNKWWGEGFTEWTNVKPAMPQFNGHYQPHIPGELGYYDLLDVEVQKRQVALAKNYGVGGFCFYFYWFDGKTLLEKPIENYLLNEELDLPFCLTWANENWTRRWDGLEKEILIKQQHSAEDDLAFIQHVSKYMLDKRYIRINNKPLLMVYRPSLLPNAIETAERWRSWCRANGIGEIYLANVQSHDKLNPVKIGYDASVEFPPGNFEPQNVSPLINSKLSDFKGIIYDWNTVKMQSEDYALPDYKLFRGVCPAWDNTARRKNNSIIYINNPPSSFKDWVYNAVLDTCKRFDNPDERLVFVNAWNEWAEGTHLEPDEKYGYNYLQSIYDVLQQLVISEKSIT